MAQHEGKHDECTAEPQTRPQLGAGHVINSASRSRMAAGAAGVFVDRHRARFYLTTDHLFASISFKPRSARK
jgi:hypothetical protein